MKNLIIFDCDGVLVDSEVIGCEIDAQHVTKLGFPISTEDFIRKYTGISDKTMAMMFKADTGLVIEEEYLEQRVASILKAFETRLQPLNDWALSQLESLNVQRCVASGSRRDRVIHSLKLTNQLKYFEETSIFTAQQVEKGKPAPDLFLFTAKKMQALPEDCLVIEDSYAGIQAAQAANMNVIGFLGGEHAQFDWYQEPIKKFNIPVAYNSEELWCLLKDYLKVAA